MGRVTLWIYSHRPIVHTYWGTGQEEAVGATQNCELRVTQTGLKVVSVP